MNAKRFSDKLIAWYKDHHRPLPWRATTDPYQIWLSEIILQQTRVKQGLPYYQAFVDTFPNVHALASASEQKVLRLWQGLGYYSRARNLHACAKLVSKKLHGHFPDSYEDLLKLPGVGPYTAAAIASFAFSESVAVVDGNVFRVLARIFGLDADISTATGKATFMSKAAELIDQERPGLFNQAIMEFGALQCKPTSPDCASCIFKRQCFARAHEMVEMLPVKTGKVKLRKRHFTYFVFIHSQKLAMKQRKGKDIWHGLYDFPLIESSAQQAIKKIAKNGLDFKVNRDNVIYRAKHVLTHQIIEATFVAIRTHGEEIRFDNQPLQFFNSRQVHKLPKPTLITRFLAETSF